jgi:hypothetical protein
VISTADVERLTHADEPWVAYSALLDLAGYERDSPTARAAYDRLRQHPRVIELMDALDDWPSRALERAYDPKDALWKLGMLADFGLQRDEPRIASIAERVLAEQADDGGFLHGGFAHTRTWDTRPYICIDHVQTYALARFGYVGDERLERAYAHIERWQRLDGGWHPNQLNLPGGPREAEPSCPFGTTTVLRALLADPSHRGTAAVSRAAELLLSCWARRAEPYRPVGFGIGATFGKLQYPLVQYQVLKVLDTLAGVPGVGKDARFLELLGEVTSKRGADGLWTSESVNKPYAAFDFGQKKTGSAWVTLLVLRAGRAVSAVTGNC